MNLWATLTRFFSAPPRKASRQRAPKFRPYDPRLLFRSAAPKRRSPSGRRAPPVLRAVPRMTGRGGPVRSASSGRYHFTDIGTVGDVKRAPDDAWQKEAEFGAVAGKVIDKVLPGVGSIVAKTVGVAAAIGGMLESIFDSGNAAGLSPQQLNAITAGIKKGGVRSTGSVLNQVEGRAGTKQLFDPDAPGGYRTVGGRFAD